MLSYFRINDPYRLLGVLIMWVLICLPRLIDTPDLTVIELKTFLLGEKFRAPHSLYGTLLDSSGPLMAAIAGFLNWVMGRSLTGFHVLTVLIVFLQSAFFGILLINKKAFPDNNYLPAFFFVVIASLSFDMLSLSPELLAAGVLLLALNSIFREIEFREQGNAAFTAGFFISIASLIDFSFSIYLIGALVIFIIFTSNSARKYLLLLVGFLLPHFLLMSIYYLNGNLPGLWNNFYEPNLMWSGSWLVSPKGLLILGGISLLYFLISFVWLNREAHFTKYQLQLVQTMFFWAVFAFVQILYSKNIRPQSFITLIPVMAFYITHFILLIRRKKFAEINIWIILIGILCVSYAAQFGYVNGVEYKNLIVENKPSIYSGKKILILNNQSAVYRNNMLGGGFLDWSLAEPIFNEPDYYDHILLVNKSIQEDLPEIIQDPHQYMPALFKHLPGLKSQYKKVDKITYTLISK